MMIYLEASIAAGEIAGLVLSTAKHGWWGQFIYYTQWSNLLLLAAAAVHLVFLMRRKGVPAWAERCRYYAACLTSVTFVVTVCILVPWYGHPEFFLLESNGLFQHLLCPLLAAAGLPFLGKMRKRDPLRAVAPTLLYGLVFYTLDFFRILTAPYPFMQLHEQPWYMSVLWFAVLLAAAYGIAAALRLLCGKRK